MAKKDDIKKFVEYHKEIKEIIDGNLKLANVTMNVKKILDLPADKIADAKSALFKALVIIRKIDLSKIL